MKEKAFGHRPYTFDRVVRMTLGALSIVAVVWLIYVLRHVLLPFGCAAVISYLLEPVVQFNRRLLNLKGRMVAVFVTLFGITFFLGVLAWLFVPTIVEEMHYVGAMISAYLSSEHSIPLIPEEFHQFVKGAFNLESIGEWLSGMNLVDVGSHVVSLVSSGIDFLVAIFNWLLMFLYIVFIMLDYERLGQSFRAMVPPGMRKQAFALGRDVKDSMNRYFRGQATVAALVGILFAIGFVIMGLPLAIVLGLSIGVLNLVPYMQLLSIPVTAMLCVVCSTQSGVDFWIVFGEAMLVYIVVQSIQDLILVPRIMGKAMGLNPAIILLSLSIWGTLLGLLGMIVALPMTTLLLSYYERYVIRRAAARRAIKRALKG